MAGGEQRGERPGGPARVALQKEIGLGSACAIIIGKGGTARPPARPPAPVAAAERSGREGEAGLGGSRYEAAGRLAGFLPAKGSARRVRSGLGHGGSPGLPSQPLSPRLGQNTFSLQGFNYPSPARPMAKADCLETLGKCRLWAKPLLALRGVSAVSFSLNVLAGFLYANSVERCCGYKNVRGWFGAVR